VLARVSAKKALIFIFPIAFVAYLFVSRYIEFYSLYLVRDNFNWIAQSLAIIFYMVFKGYGVVNVFFVALMSYVPIGYRLIAFVFPVLVPRHISGRYDIIVAMFIFLVSPIKLWSYSVQSIQNDGDNSIILHYDGFVK